MSHSQSICVSVRPSEKGMDRTSGQPISAEFAYSHHPTVETAIQRSHDFLLKEQKAEGYWVGELMVDSTLVSDTIAYHHWNGKVDPEWQRKAVNHILSMQLPDGGWNIYHGGPSEVNATIKAYLALKLAGVPVTDPRMLARARNRAEPRRRAAHEHLFQAVPRAARAFPVGLCSDDSLRSHPHRQMVSRELSTK